jgi:hypothetical protein
MAHLRHKLTALQARLYCPMHRGEALICSACDLMELTANEGDELAFLLEQAGYFDREPWESLGTCWRCQEGRLACLACLNDRGGEPPGLARMPDAARERLLALGAKLVPPWLEGSFA